MFGNAIEVTGDGGLVSGATSLEPNTLVFTFDAPLSPGQTYGVKVTTQVSDVVGNALPEADSFSFATSPLILGDTVDGMPGHTYQLVSTSYPLTWSEARAEALFPTEAHGRQGALRSIPRGPDHRDRLNELRSRGSSRPKPKQFDLAMTDNSGQSIDP